MRSVVIGCAPERASFRESHGHGDWSPTVQRILIDLAHGNLFFFLLLTMFTSILLGLGLPIMVCYFLLPFSGPPLDQDGSAADPAATCSFSTMAYWPAFLLPSHRLFRLRRQFAGRTQTDRCGSRGRIAAPIFVVPFVFLYSPVFILRSVPRYGCTCGCSGAAILGVYQSHSPVCRASFLYRSKLNFFWRSIILIGGSAHYTVGNWKVHRFDHVNCSLRAGN